MINKYVFGPVRSRRLGISLGIDITPEKTCSYDCIYCESGKTDTLCTERKNFADFSEVIKEIAASLDLSPELDYVTFSGSGEPTLNSKIGDYISYIKRNYPSYKIALLTNSSLLNKDEVRSSIIECDLIIPSLDTVLDSSFRKLNRPAPGVKIGDIMEGITKLCLEAEGKVWLEILFVKDINDTKEDIAAIKDFISGLKIDGLYIHTVDRPPAYEGIEAVSGIWLEKILEEFSLFNTRLVQDTECRAASCKKETVEKEDILSVLSRRPSTIKDLVVATGGSLEALKDSLHELETSGKISRIKKERGDFYTIK